MFREYAPLRWSPLKSTAGVAEVRVVQPPRVTLDSPALSVMTDFSLTPAATIEPETGIEHANDYMKRRGVRALLVTDAEGGVVGMLTATDVLGGKPGCRYHDPAWAARAACIRGNPPRAGGSYRRDIEGGGTPALPGGGTQRRRRTGARNLFSHTGRPPTRRPAAAEYIRPVLCRDRSG